MSEAKGKADADPEVEQGDIDAGDAEGSGGGGTPAAGKAGAGSRSDIGPFVPVWFGGSVMVVIFGGIACTQFPGLGEWARTQWIWILIVWGVVSVAGFGLSKVAVARDWLRRASETTKSAVIIFGLIPSLILLVLSVPLVPEAYRDMVVHVVFILVLCLLPGAMYYLFIVTRRPSILNEYVANLTRLGLIGTRVQEDGELNDLRRRRVESYVQRFEAAYGPIQVKRDELLNELAQRGDATPTKMSPAAIAYPRGSVTGMSQVFPREVLVQLSLTTLLLALGWLLVLPPMVRGEGSPSGPLVPELTPVNVAFIGAYFFTLQMLFRRFIRRDLNVKVYVNMCVRIILAVIAAWIIAIAWAFVNPSRDRDIYSLLASGLKGASDSQLGLLIAAFVCGAFPRTLWAVLAALAKKLPGIPILLPGITSGQPLSELDGVTVWHESRFEEEDIENVANLAGTDVLELMLQTRFPPERLMRWLDESILLTSLGPPPEADEKIPQPPLAPRDRLKQLGILTATDLYIACSKLGRDPAEAADSACETADKDLSAAMHQIVRTFRVRACNFTLLRAWYGIDLRKTSGAKPPAGEHGAGPPGMGNQETSSMISASVRAVAGA